MFLFVAITKSFEQTSKGTTVDVGYRNIMEYFERATKIPKAVYWCYVIAFIVSLLVNTIGKKFFFQEFMSSW